MKATSGRLLYLIAWALLFVSFGIRFFLTFHRRFNADEFQHLHASWMVHAGYLPYRDFWENHTPLLFYIFAPAFTLFEDKIFLIFALRAFMSALALIILWMTYRIARLYHDRPTSIFAVVALSFAVLFLQKTIEFRPDQFLVSLWLASLLICLRSFQSQPKALTMIFGGALLGIAMLFSPKALLCLAAAMVTFAAYYARNLNHANFRSAILTFVRCSFFYTVGFFVPVAICALFFWQRQSLITLVQSTVLENLNYPFSRRPTYLLSLQHIVFFILGFAGIVVCWMERHSNKSNQSSQLLLAVPCLFLLAIFVFALPSPFPQSALLFVPLLAVYAGVAMSRSTESLLLPQNAGSIQRQLIFASVILAAVITPCVGLLIKQPSTASNTEQLQLLRVVLEQTNTDDVFFDGNAAYIFRPQAYYYGSLVEGIRYRLQTRIAEDVKRSMKERRCKFVIYDDRVSQLPGTLQEFIRNNYIQTQIPDVLIAGRELGVENISGRKATFWIEIPLTYEIQVRNAKRFVVDGRPYRSSIFLKSGSHFLVAEKPLQHVIIRAAATR